MGGSLREFGESRRHPHAGGTCRQVEGAGFVGLREDPRALPQFIRFLCACYAARNRADSMPAFRALRAIRLDSRGNMAVRSRAPGNPSGKTGSS